MSIVKTNRILVILCLVALSSCLSFPELEETGIQFSTEASEIPPAEELTWITPGEAHELIHVPSQAVYVSAGSNPITEADWADFKIRFPYSKNFDRNLLFDATVFLRSPGKALDCTDCYTEIAYKDYTWHQLAIIVGVTHIPEETNVITPDPGHVVVKTIEKCQVVRYDAGEIYQLSDGAGNLYVMHATETGMPTLDVNLPEGWTLDVVTIEEPLIIPPFGGGDHCYFNILGDHLGQGYHQYEFAESVFPLVL